MMMEREIFMRVQEILTATNQKHYLLVDEHGELVVPVILYLKYLDSIGRARNPLRLYAHGLKLFFEYLSQQRLDHKAVTLDDLGGFVLWSARLLIDSCVSSRLSTLIPLRTPRR